LPTLIMVYLFEPEGFAFLKFQRKTFVTVLLFTALLVFICSPVINILANFNQKLQLPANWAGLQGWIENSEHEASILTETFLFTSSLSGLFLNILIMAILPAIGEELLFRGLLQQYFIKLSKNAHIGIWITAIIFSAFHMQFFGFLPRMFLGLVLGYLFYYTNNLWYPIAFHFVNNALNVLFYYLKQHGLNNLNPENIGIEHNQQWMVFVSLAFIGLVFYFIRKLIHVETR